jgi:hypothetical protein
MSTAERRINPHLGRQVQNYARPKAHLERRYTALLTATITNETILAIHYRSLDSGFALFFFLKDYFDKQNVHIPFSKRGKTLLMGMSASGDGKTITLSHSLDY